MTTPPLERGRVSEDVIPGLDLKRCFLDGDSLNPVFTPFGSSLFKIGIIFFSSTEGLSPQRKDEIEREFCEALSGIGLDNTPKSRRIAEHWAKQLNQSLAVNIFRGVVDG